MSTDRPAATDQQPKVYGTEATAEPRARRRVPPLPGEVEIVDTDGCHRACRNGHTYRWGGCEYAEEPPPTLARWKTFTASDGCLSVGTETLSAEQVAEWLREQGYTVATRASEAPADAQSPTPDVGAAQGGEDGSAAESEPRECDGADDPRRRCRRHHTTDIGNAMGGYNCCCGWAWLGRANECSTGAKTGDPVPLCDYVSDLLGYVANTSGSEDFDAQAAAVIPAIRAQAIADAYSEVTKLQEASTYQDGYGWFERAAYANVLDTLTRIARGDQ